MPCIRGCHADTSLARCRNSAAIARTASDGTNERPKRQPFERHEPVLEGDRRQHQAFNEPALHSRRVLGARQIERGCRSACPPIAQRLGQVCGCVRRRALAARARSVDRLLWGHCGMKQSSTRWSPSARRSHRPANRQRNLTRVQTLGSPSTGARAASIRAAATCSPSSRRSCRGTDRWRGRGGFKAMGP